MTATPTFSADYTQEMHEGYQLSELAHETQRAARFVGHLASRIPQDWSHPSDLYDYMDILATTSLEAANRIDEQRQKIQRAHDLETPSAGVLCELAAINVVASAWVVSNLTDETTNVLVTGGWWATVVTGAGDRLRAYANIGDEWEARKGEAKGGDDA
jgi:hypothetical protein